MVLTVSFVLSPVIGLFCHRHPWNCCPTNLTPASGCQDHTTSPSALALFVNSAAASTASRPASVTIAIRPSVGRDGRVLKVIWVKRETEYFFKRDWTAQITLIRFNKIVPRRKGYDAADLPVGQISVTTFAPSPSLGGAERRSNPALYLVAPWIASPFALRP